MVEATIEERLRLYGSKTRNFSPSEVKVARFQAPLSSPSERNHARFAFKRFFHHIALAYQSALDLLLDQTTR